MLKRKGRKKQPHSTIKRTLILFMVILIASINLVVGVSNYWNMKDFIDDYVNVYMTQIVISASDQFDSIMKETYNFIIRVANSSQISQFIQSHTTHLDNLTAQEKFTERAQLETHIQELYPNWEYIQFLGLYYGDKNYYYGTVASPEIYGDIQEKIEPKLKELDRKDDKEVVTVQILNKDLVAIIQPIFDFDSGEQLCQLVIALNIRNFRLSIIDDKLAQNGRLQIVDAYGCSIYPSQIDEPEDWQQAKKILLDQSNSHRLPTNSVALYTDTMYVKTVKSNYFDWYIVGYVPMSDMMQGLNMRLIFTIVLTIVGIALAALFCVLLGRKITNPFERIIKGMAEIEKENYTVQINDSSFYETQYICTQFNHMSSHLHQLIHDVYLSQLREKEAQFAALQAQINPHFLYNALDNMNMMLIVRGQEDISDFVMQLSELMRYNIDTTRNRVTLWEDLEQVRKYLFIQKIRFGARLSYSIACQEEIKNIQIVKLLIQPLAENAIIHGIEPLTQGGEIKIRAWLQNGKVIVEIFDNGVGIKEKDLPRIFGQEGWQPQGHIGIKNVHARIQQFYGEEYGLHIILQDQGTCIQIELPYNAK